jgi:hypothetical protein
MGIGTRAAVRMDKAITGGPQPELTLAEAAQIEELRAKAARYRQLAEGLFDPGLVSVVLACARELDAEAATLEAAKTAGRR